MRISPFLAILLAALFTFPLAAQEGAMANPGSSIQPLPQGLAPRQRSGDATSAPLDPIEAGALTGMLVGAAVGGIYGAFFADECGVEDDCMLSREVKTVGFVAIGSGLGGIIGLGTSYLLHRRASTGDSAPLRVAPSANGVSVGVMLRH